MTKNDAETNHRLSEIADKVKQTGRFCYDILTTPFWVNHQSCGEGSPSAHVKHVVSKDRTFHFVARVDAEGEDYQCYSHASLGAKLLRLSGKTKRAEVVKTCPRDLELSPGVSPSRKSITLDQVLPSPKHKIEHRILPTLREEEEEERTENRRHAVPTEEIDWYAVSALL